MFSQLYTIWLENFKKYGQFNFRNFSLIFAWKIYQRKVIFVPDKRSWGRVFRWMFEWRYTGQVASLLATDQTPLSATKHLQTYRDKFNSIGRHDRVRINEYSFKYILNIVDFIKNKICVKIFNVSFKDF